MGNFMINCCCCCDGVCCWWIGVMGFHSYGLGTNKLSCCCWFMSLVFHFVKWLVDFVKLVLSWSCEGPKMNFWYMRLLTEFLMLLDELDLTKFLFSCCGCVSRVVLEKRVFREKSRCLSIFANKWLWKILGK